MATQSELERKIQEQISQLSGQTKSNWEAILRALINSGAPLNAFEQALEDIENLVDTINGDLRTTAEIFKKLVDKLKEENALFQFQTTLLSKANSILRDTLDIRKGETYADASHIKNLQRQIEADLMLFNNLKERQDLSSEQIEEIEKQIQGLESTQKQLDKILVRDKEINKELSLSARNASTLDGIFKKIGLPNLNLQSAYQNTVQMGQAAKAAGVQFNASAYYSKLVGNNMKQLGANLRGAGLLYLLVELVDAIKSSDKATGELAKGFNITYNEAANLRNELIDIGFASGDIAINARALQESMMAIGKALGTNAKLNEKDLVFMTQLREKAGFTNEELIGIEKTTLAVGRNLKDNVKSLMFSAKTTALNNNVLLNEKDIMRDISATSDAIKLSLGGSGKNLGIAAAQAKALGMNLDQVDKIARGLLDFESSISAELEAQLLTGKNINLEQARLFALNNDYEGLSREIARNFGTAAEFSNMNRLQQEAIAKAVGMERDELAKTLTDKEALKEISKEDLGRAKEALAAARAKGMTEEQIAKQGIEDLMKQQSLQDRFNNTVEKLKEIFVGVANSLLPILDTLASVFSLVAYMVKPLGDLMSWAGSFSPMLRTVTGLLIAAGAAALFLNASLTAGLGVAATLAAIGAGMSYLDSKVKPLQEVEDASISFQGGRPVVNAMSKGTIQPIMGRNDDIIFTTNKPIRDRAEGFDMNALISSFKNIIDSRPIQINTIAQIDGEIATRNINKYTTVSGNVIDQNLYQIA